jgi:hypothetical protein
MLTNGWKSVTDAERSGQPSTSTTDEKKEEATAIILADRRLTTEEIELELGIGQDTAYSLMLDIFLFSQNFREVGAQTLRKSIRAIARTSAAVFRGTTGKVISS